MVQASIAKYGLKFQVWISLTLLLLTLQYLLFLSYPSLIGCECPSARMSNVTLNSDSKNFDKSSSIVIDDYPVKGPFSWECIDEDLRNEYTLNGQIPVKRREFIVDNPFHQGMTDKSKYLQPVAHRWTAEVIHIMVKRVHKKDPNDRVSAYGADIDLVFHAGLARHPVKGMDVLVVGSTAPWVEAFCIAYEAKSITTVDFNVPVLDDPTLVRTMSIADLAKSRETFDIVISYSSLEHDGMGRYGDPLNPNGDIERMKRLKLLVRPKGKLFLGVPTGPDCLVWNAHRVYGPIRFPKLTEGWKLIDTFTCENECMNVRRPKDYEQPLQILVPE